MPKFLRSVATAAAGAAAYSLVEPRLYRLQTHELQVRAGVPGLRVLHLSDTHLNRRDSGLLSFLRSLGDRLEEVPDIVALTGDLIEEDAAIDPLVDALGHIEARYGRFYVLGSHDYYIGERPAFKKYFTSDREVRTVRRADTSRLERGLRDRGWVSLVNTTTFVDVSGGRVRVSGVDDPYLRRHRTDHIERGTEDAAIALVHAPDLVSEWALNDFDLILAGHTHGGQVRAPLLGALVTNCSLPAGLACGPNRVGSSWLHVSPGLGTGRFSPIRFLARPEATLLRCTSR